MNVGHKKRSISMYVLLGVIYTLFDALIIYTFIYYLQTLLQMYESDSYYPQVALSLVSYMCRLGLYSLIITCGVLSIAFTNKLKILSLFTLFINLILHCVCLIELIGNLANSMGVLSLIMCCGTIPLLIISIVDFILIKPFRKEAK